MIRPSPEIEAMARRWFEAGGNRDADTLRHLLSEDDRLRFVGTSTDELWTGQGVREGIAAHYQEMPALISRETISLDAFENGTIGWAFALQNYQFAGQPEPLAFCATLIFTLEHGSWKIIHRHTSIPRSNTELFGREHHAIADLVEAARNGFRLDQREGLATVMFTDIVNSSRIADLVGNRIWASRIADHLDRVAEVIAEHGGQLVKSLGDGSMSSFPSAGAALRAAIAVQQGNAADTVEPRLDMRVGLHTGDVIQTKDDFFGTVVNKAARIAAAAEPGTIRVSEASRIMVGQGGDLAFSNPVNVSLKGLEGDHLLYRLEWTP